MKLIVAGSLRLPPEKLDELRAPMREMVEATRAEDGCIKYGYAEDVLDPGLIHIFEIWRDQAALDAHLASPHMARLRPTWQYAVTERSLSIFDIAAERPL